MAPGAVGSMSSRIRPQARTTPKVRQEIKDSGLSSREAPKVLNIPRTTAQKWLGRRDLQDRSHRAHTLHTTLSQAEEAAVLPLRQSLYLPLDNLLFITKQYLNPAVSRATAEPIGSHAVETFFVQNHGIFQHTMRLQDANFHSQEMKEEARGIAPQKDFELRLDLYISKFSLDLVDLSTPTRNKMTILTKAPPAHDTKNNIERIQALIQSPSFGEIKTNATERPLFAHRLAKSLKVVLSEFSINDPTFETLPLIATELGVESDSIVYSDANFDNYDILETHAEEMAVYGTANVIGENIPKAIQDRSGSTHRRPEINVYRVTANDLYIGFERDLPIAFRKINGRIHALDKILPESYPLINLAGGLSTQIIKSNVLEVDQAVFISDNFAFSNYAHWTLDWVPRLKWIGDHCDFSTLTIVFNKKPTKFHYEMLERLGFRRENIVSPEVHSPTFYVKTKTLFTTNLAQKYRHSCHAGAAWSIDFLRQHFRSKKQSAFDYGLRLVIMRNQRGVTFSDVVRKDLESKGFIFVRTQLLDHNTQVELFSNAREIIASHGAGLSNLVFCRPGTKVLELFNKTLSTHAFYTVSHFGGLVYSCAVTTSLKPDKSGKPIHDSSHLDEITYFQWINSFQQ